MKINKVPDLAFLFRAAGLFSDICYPLHGTNVFKIQIYTCCNLERRLQHVFIRLEPTKAMQFLVISMQT